MPVPTCVTVDEESACYYPYAQWVEVYLDGVKQNLVTYANPALGEVIRYVTTPEGKLVFVMDPAYDRGMIARKEFVRGRVELRLMDRAPHWLRDEWDAP
jgi:hypothetical protein